MPPAKGWVCIAPTMRGENWTRITTDPRPAMKIGGGDLPDSRRGPEESGRRLQRQHRHHALDRRRQDVDQHSRRARRRRLSEHLDQSRQSRHHPAGRDQGALVTVNGGETWSSWYNQPTAQLYHVDHRRTRFPKGLRGTAGERIGLHLQPRQ